MVDEIDPLRYICYVLSIISFTNFYFVFSGKKEDRNYENGVLNGSAVTYGVEGDKFEFTYVDGRIEGSLFVPFVQA